MPRFCWAFVMKSDKSYEFLAVFTLAVEIRQDLNGSNLHKKAYMDTQKNLEGDAHAENEVEFEDSAALGGIARSNTIRNSQTITDHQLDRLWEPLRRFHSLNGVHIEGPITQEYKAALVTSMCGPEPSDLELFDGVLTIYYDATAAHDMGDWSSAIPKRERTLDIINDYKRTIPSKPHPLSPPRDACDQMQYSTWLNLASASLLLNGDNPANVRVASDYLQQLISIFVDERRDYWKARPKGRGMAMIFELKVNVWKAYDDLGCRSDDLRTVIGYIQEGLWHEPKNHMLNEELKRKMYELQNSEETEDLMEIFDRINELGEFAPSGRGQGG